MSVTSTRKAGLCFWVVTPRLTTSAGRRDEAWETRFCTSTCALLGSVPGRNVIVICNVPSEPATDFMYIMPSAPLICSSNGADTVSAMTLGLAPGYVALTTTVRSEEHTSELQSLRHLVCRLLL